MTFDIVFSLKEGLIHVWETEHLYWICSVICLQYLIKLILHENQSVARNLLVIESCQQWCLLVCAYCAISLLAFIMISTVPLWC